MAFLGIRVPHETGRLLAKVDAPGEKTSVSEMHITLLHLGDNWPVAELCKALEPTYNVVSETQPFLVSMKKMTHFSKGPNSDDKFPIISRVESKELHNFRDEIAKAFDKEKIEFSKLHKDYKPHITLAYSDEEPDDVEFEHPVEFVVQEIVLWGGDHGDDRIFVTFPLAGPEKTKNAVLLQKADIFEKIAGNPLQEFLTPSYERRKTER
jgi:2'-5' RNA ligase